MEEDYILRYTSESSLKSSDVWNTVSQPMNELINPLKGWKTFYHYILFFSQKELIFIYISNNILKTNMIAGILCKEQCGWFLSVPSLSPGTLGESNDDHHSHSLLCSRNYVRPCIHVILTIEDEKISSETQSNLLKVIQQSYGVWIQSQTWLQSLYS